MYLPSSQPERLRVAVIGCGPIGNLHAHAITGSSHARLVAVCDPDASRRDALAGQTGVPGFAAVEALLAEHTLDAVTIATPDHLHVQPALAAIAAGCHVFCEKPLAAELADAQRIAQAAADRPVLLGVDYNRRFACGYRAARRLLDESAIGQLMRVTIDVSDATPPAAVARHPYVIFTTLLTHHFDLLRWFAGEASQLQATAGPNSNATLVRDVTVECTLAGGIPGTLTARYVDDQPRTRERMALVGTRGQLVVDDAVGKVTLERDGQAAEVLTRQPQSYDDAFAATISEHVRTFFASLAQGQPPPVTVRDGLAGLRWAEAIIASLKSGQSIEVRR